MMKRIKSTEAFPGTLDAAGDNAAVSDFPGASVDRAEQPAPFHSSLNRIPMCSSLMRIRMTAGTLLQTMKSNACWSSRLIKGVKRWRSFPALTKKSLKPLLTNLPNHVSKKQNSHQLFKTCHFPICKKKKKSMEIYIQMTFFIMTIKYQFHSFKKIKLNF